MGFEPTKKFGELLINDVSMHTPAWMIRDVVHLWFESDPRSEYSEVPGKDGEDPTTPYQNTAVLSMDFKMCGDVDHTGEPYEAADGWEAWAIGFRSNFNYLATNVLTGRNLTGLRTRAAELIVPGPEDNLTAPEVHVWLAKGAINSKNVWVTTLTLKIAQGAFL